MKAAPRQILHVDMDSFFASIEQRDRPELRGKPVLIGGTGRRGVVSTASYEARPFGCHSAQPMAVAPRLCPEAIVLPTDGKKYAAVSEQLFDLFRDVSPLVEPLSVDEAFLDVTGCERLWGSAVEVARDLKARVRAEMELTASVGVAANKFLAKLASDLEKPDGLTVIMEDDIDRVLPPLPVGRLWGVGPRTAERLHARGVKTIGDLRAWSERELEREFGSSGAHYWRLARGLDDRDVVPDSRAKSISQERTFAVDVDDREHVRDVLRGQVEDVARRLRRSGLKTRTVGLKIRYGDFETITRSMTFDRPTDMTAELQDAAFTLFMRWVRSGFKPVRLIGMGASQLVEPADEQLGLFGEPEKARNSALDKAMDALKDRFGGDVIGRGLAPKPARSDGDVPEADRKS
ncbi:MAG: DNA polymerase IV [Planctomycetota bacterium]|nr:DNA polymerase IV [Planctomycetota bacterium]